MKRFKPIHGIILVLTFIAAVVYLRSAFDGPSQQFETVRPGPDGMVRVDLSRFQPLEVRFFRFLNRGNQEVKFFAGRDREGTVQVAFDASENHYKRGRGFRRDGEWIVDNQCGTSCRLSEVNNGGGGCRPIPVAHRVEGDQLVLAESDILAGWRLFR